MKNRKDKAEKEKFEAFVKTVMMLNRIVIPGDLMDEVEKRLLEKVLKDPGFEVIQDKLAFITGFSQGICETYISMMKISEEKKDKKGDKDED